MNRDSRLHCPAYPPNRVPGHRPAAVWGGADAPERLLLRVVDGALAGSVFLVPFLMGGRIALAELALAALAACAAVAWAADCWLSRSLKWRPTWALPLVLVGAGLVAVQIVPLPQGLSGWLSPRQAEILPMWGSTSESAFGWGPWQTISLGPAASRAGLIVFLSYGLLHLVAVQRVRSLRDVERLLRWCGAAAVAMAVFGLAEFVAGNGKFYWFYEHPFSSASEVAKGAFANRNHFAQFLALGIGPLIWWLQDAQRRAGTQPGGLAFPSGPGWPRRDRASFLLVLALGVVLFAGLLSLSRGGIVVILLAAGIATAACWRAAALGRGFVLGMAAAGLLMGLALTIFGAELVRPRLEDLCSGSVERLDQARGRRAIWAAAAKAIPDFWPAGSGVGTLAQVYPMYTDFAPDPPVTYTHAENSYLQVAVETGLPGLMLVLAGVGLCGFWCTRGLRRARSPRHLVCAGAVAAGLAASAVHAAVDFTWYVPGCMTPVVLLAACAGWLGDSARGPGTAERVRRLPRQAAGLLLVLLLGLGGWMITSRVGPVLAERHWHRYELARYAQQSIPSGIDTRDPEALRKADLAAAERERTWIGWLRGVVTWQPDHAQAHVELAQCHLRLFDLIQATGVNPMPLLHLRDAAVQSQFGSREELTAWLARAVGEHWHHLEQALRHARIGLSLAPLEGRAYLYVGELAFLEGAGPEATRLCVRQALRVRPYDGEVLYAAGTEALVAGDFPGWLDRLQRSFRCGRQHRQRIIRELLAGVADEGLQEMTEFIIESFAPELEELRILHGLAARRGRPEQLAPLRSHLAARLESAAQKARGPQAAQLWMEAHRLRAALGQRRQALCCARNAHACDPNNYEVRSALASCLIDEGEFAEAEAHLYWCLRRRPADRSLQASYKTALAGRLGRRADRPQGEPK
ncbi:MAG: O-antigen ligase family protein [Thermoguttaceae bacterium]